MEKNYHFSSSQLLGDLSKFLDLGITRLTIKDTEVIGSKEKLVKFLSKAQNEAPEIFYTLYVDYNLIDKDLCMLLSNLYCSLQIVLTEKALSNRKVFEKKINLLNRNGLVFGFEMDFALGGQDTIKVFRERLDFALGQYPNHIDFPQLDGDLPPHTRFFSPYDIQTVADCAFACRVFYSAGRAVPWFLSVLQPLKMTPSRFFSDFAEWLQCNNCGLSTGFDAFAVSHQDIEKMQLLFLEIKYEEKKQGYLFSVVEDIVKFNSAFARLAGEGEECELELAFHPNDLSSPYVSNIVAFAENVCMEHCRVKIYISQDAEGNEFPDYKML